MSHLEIFSEIPKQEYEAGLDNRVDGLSLLVDESPHQMNVLLFDGPDALTFPFKPRYAALAHDGEGVDLVIDIVDKDLNRYPGHTYMGKITDTNMWIPSGRASLCACGQHALLKEGYAKDFWGGLLSGLVSHAELNA